MTRDAGFKIFAILGHLLSSLVVMHRKPDSKESPRPKKVRKVSIENEAPGE